MSDSLKKDAGRRETRLQRQKLEALGRFSGGIAHDFNNILSIIEGHTHAAMKRLSSGTLTPAELERILLSTQRGAGLTRQLLAFGRQKIGIDEKTDICAALHSHAVLLQPVLGEMIALEIEAPENGLWVAAAEDHITQILLNLALNARDAMPRGGRISIVCMQEDSAFIKLSVSDSGEGMAETTLARIFDPFFTTKMQGRGTGLGLSVVYGIVDQLEGRIDVQSRQGAGSVFHVFLPVAAPPEKENLLQGAQPVLLKGKTILLAEDEPELRSILTDMLTEMDLKVMHASNGNHAMEIQHDYKGEIDFLLTDVVMPEMDGLRLGKLFSVRRPRTDVIYMSGYPFLDSQPHMQVPEEDVFLSKPVQSATVRQILERALERRRAREEAET